MIISLDELKAQIDCGDLNDTVIISRLTAIEEVIRAYTNNNFQVREARFAAMSSNGVLLGASPFIGIGDTVQISQTAINDGVYTVVAVEDDKTEIDRFLYPLGYNLVTKVVYPADVVQCAIDLFEWKLNFGSKIGIKSESETLSRHSESVTYEDSTTLFMGYPTGILKGLALHQKARF